jgi:hypothetical protein
VELKLGGIHQLLLYADLLGDNINTIKKNTEALINAGKKVGIEVNTEKTTYMLSRHRNTGHNHNIKTAVRSFESVVKFKYLGITENPTSHHEELKGI